MPYGDLTRPLPTGDRSDICVAELDEARAAEARFVAAVHDLHARFRMRPDKMPLWDDPKRLHGFKNLYLLTDLGQIDFLGELPGICSYAELNGKTVSLDVGGFACRILDIDTLIAAKTIAGRPKDINGVYHLEAIRRKLRERGEEI